MLLQTWYYWQILVSSKTIQLQQKNYNSRALNFFNEHNNYDKKLGL
jgi:hypothetical protein